jgi:hypothetical protein
MSEQLQAPADAKLGWAEMTSDNGGDYRVKASDYDIADQPDGEGGNVTAANGPTFLDEPVNWSCPSSGTPSQEFQNKTGITWYKLDKAPWYSPKKYRLTISCKDSYNYSFTDESPDTYWLNVFMTSTTHSVEYDSARPTIVKISGQ